jgi:hypothetical protein
MNTSRASLLWLLKRAGLTLAVLVLALALLEGLASLGLLAHDLLAPSASPLAERAHTQYDPELGWSNIPGKVVPDLYGPGRSVSINAQGFRRTRDLAPAASPGVVRILCSGDSFTFGYGVDDADTWCAQLEQMSPGCEVVNMGQGGYGLDQSYLWYLRDGFRLDHRIHIFAVTYCEFQRMVTDRFLGYGKPVLRLEGNVPVADHVPVPRRAAYRPRLNRDLEAVRGLRLAQLLGRRSVGEGTAEDERILPSAGIVDLAQKAVETMSEADRRHGSRLVVVWLPMPEDRTAGPRDELRTAFARAVISAGVPVVDLVPALQGLAPAAAEALYLRPGEVNFPGAAGHYAPAGNRFVAGLLREGLRGLPELAGIYSRREDAPALR